MKLKKLITFFVLCFLMCNTAFATNVKFAKVVFVGDYGCGKTSIWKRLMGEGFDQDETRSDKIISRDIVKYDGEDIINLRIYDTAGLDRYYKDVVNFTADANFIFIVHDLDKEFDDSKENYLSKIYRDIHEKISGRDCKIVLVGSKLDLRCRNIVNSARQAKLLDDVARHIPCALILTSAKNENDTGINAIVDFIVKNCKNMTLPDKSPENVLRFGVDLPSDNGGCKIL